MTLIPGKSSPFSYQNPFQLFSSSNNPRQICYPPFREPYIPRIKSGCNSIAIREDAIKKLAIRDILVKLGEFKIPRKKFDSFPEPAQLGLLDLSYTGSLSGDLIDAALKEDWKELAFSQSFAKRLDPSYLKRNAQVKAWFMEAQLQKNLKVTNKLGIERTSKILQSLEK